MSYMSFKCLHNLSAFADFAVFDFVCLEEGQELFSGPGIRIACAARWLSALKACEISCFESAKVIMFQISVSFRHSIKICRPDSPSSVFCHSQCQNDRWPFWAKRCGNSPELLHSIYPQLQVIVPGSHRCKDLHKNKIDKIYKDAELG